MKKLKQPIKTPNGLSQKITGILEWTDYMRLLHYCRSTKQSQMEVVGQAVVSELDRQERAEQEGRE